MRVFNAEDRCTRCNAQAKHEATKGELILLFCNHHFKDHREKLYADDWDVVSELSPDNYYVALV